MGDGVGPSDAAGNTDQQPVNVTAILRLAAAFGVLAGSVYLAGLGTVASGFDRFLADNRLAAGARGVAAAAAVALPLAAFLAVFVALRSGKARLEDLEVWIRRLAPLFVLGLVPALFSRRLWRGAELPLLVFLGSMVWTLERLLRTSLPELRAVLPPRLRAWQPSARSIRWACRGLLATAVLFYAVRVSELTVLMHHRLQTQTADLAEFDNLFFNALGGHPFRAPAIDGDTADFGALKVHAEFLLYLLLPFYALAPGPETLLVLQSCIVALGAVPVYLFAARRLGEPTALLFAVAYLLLPAVQQPNFYDFHFVPLGALCVAWTLFFADVVSARPWNGTPRWARAGFVVAFALGLLSREDVSFGLALLGAFFLLSGRAPLLGAAVLAVAASFFAIVKFELMPRFGSMWFSEIFEALKAPGRHGYGAVVDTLLTNPAFVLKQLLSESRLLYLAQLAVPLAFLWLRRPWLCLALAPGLPFTLLATDRPPLQQISFQYVYHHIPYLFAASVLGFELLGSRGSAQRVAAGLALALGVGVASFHFGALLGAPSIMGGFSEKRLSINRGERQRYQRLEHVMRPIPTDASVGATDLVGPHVSTRLDVFPLDIAADNDPDYLALDLRDLDKDPLESLSDFDLDHFAVVRAEREFVLLGRQERYPDSPPADEELPKLARALR